MALFQTDLRGFIVPLGLIAAAEIAARATHLDSNSLASPSQILVAGWEALGDGTLVIATGQTLSCAFAGLAIGVLIGTSLGILLGLFQLFDQLMEITLELIRPLPSVALIPIMLLVYGFGYRMEIATVAFATTWPTFVLTRAAIANVEPRLMEVSRLLGLSLAARIFKIVVPAALPRMFVALRLSLGIALIVAFTVEISSNTLGLGYTMMSAVQSLNPALMLAFLFWIGLLGWVFNVLMLAVQAKLFPSRSFEGGQT